MGAGPGPAGAGTRGAAQERASEAGGVRAPGLLRGMLPWTALSLALSLALAWARSGAERGECGARGPCIPRGPHAAGALLPPAAAGRGRPAGHPTHLRRTEPMPRRLD